MDQAAKLREYKKKKNSDLDYTLVSVVSGKGGVGKTSLVKEIYEETKDSFIIDCDFNSIYIWNGLYPVEKGFDVRRNKSSLRDIDLNLYASKDNIILIDCGTGLNPINSHYIEKSKVTIIVTTLEEMSILNAATLLKNVEGNKIIYVTSGSSEDVFNLGIRFSKFSAKSLGGEEIPVVGDIDSLLIEMKKKI